MGANAQTSVPAFTAGQVLTAQQQTEINTGVPVFADTSARDAAFGGTGEKTLAEGQLAYLEDVNIVQFYNGTTWASLFGLVYITSGSVTLGSSLSFDNCFSSTYANYIIQLTHTAANNPTMRLRAGGSDISLTNYGFQNVYYVSSAYGGASTTGATSWTISQGAGYSAPTIFVGNPFASTNTAISVNTNRTDDTIWNMVSGRYAATTSCDGFSILGTSLTVTARVYGLVNS